MHSSAASLTDGSCPLKGWRRKLTRASLARCPFTKISTKQAESSPHKGATTARTAQERNMPLPKRYANYAPTCSSWMSTTLHDESSSPPHYLQRASQSLSLTSPTRSLPLASASWSSTGTFAARWWLKPSVLCQVLD